MKTQEEIAGLHLGLLDGLKNGTIPDRTEYHMVNGLLNWILEVPDEHLTIRDQMSKIVLDHLANISAQQKAKTDPETVSPEGEGFPT